VGSTRRNSSRLGVLCLAIAYLLLQLGGAWHLSQQEHARCAAHGEWIDVARSPFASAPASHPGPIVDASAPTQEHDHCTIVETSRVRAVVCDVAPFEQIHGVVVAIDPARADDPLGLGFDRYLLAPKQSPPC